MPPRTSQGAEPPRKRVTLDEPHRRAQTFTSAQEIQVTLRKQDQDLIDGLVSWRNQLTVKSHNDTVALDDARLVLVRQWLQVDFSAQTIFELWEGAGHRQHSLLVSLVSVLSSLLTLLSQNYADHALGMPIIKTLLSAQWMRRINSYLGGSHTELILVTLKLLNGLSSYAAGKERRTVLEMFSWETKTLSKLLYMRRKVKKNELAGAIVRPDIRSLYISFVLSFVDAGAASAVKIGFLDRHADIFLSIFKGLAQDPFPAIRNILEICWTGIWSDPKLKRTLKIGLFQEATISHITKLYDRDAPEGSENDQSPADLAHHFLLAICTHPGTGVCFKDKGWFPRDIDDVRENETGDRERRGGKVYNKILCNVLKTLKANEDPRQQELALRIMTACPELVASFWPGAALTFEPRLSSKWITNISLLGLIVSLPVPLWSFLLPGAASYYSSPPPLSTILENILPSVNLKTHLSKGLQSPSGLVRHCTAIALAKCLVKLEETLRIFSDVAKALGEDEEGQWMTRRHELEREARRRVPDFQVVVAYSQLSAMPEEVDSGSNTTKTALLAESAQRVLWMYHRCLPEVVAEARFDIGKVLSNFMEGMEGGGYPLEQQSPLDAAARLHIARKLHIIRLLQESDQFAWSAKMASSSHSYLYTLLRAYGVSPASATRRAIGSLLVSIMSKSAMFYEHSHEPEFWLDSLPNSCRVPGCEAPDGAPLTDEGDSVITFLDDCVQRFLKTPHRYLDQMHELGQQQITDTLDDYANMDISYPNPIFATLLEQLGIKVTNKLLSPSDVLAIACFIRKLLYRLSSELCGLQFLRVAIDKIDSLLCSEQLFPQFPRMTSAIRREVMMLRICLGDLQITQRSLATDAGTVVQDLLSQAEGIPVPSSQRTRIEAASKLVDCLRFLDVPLQPTDLARLIHAVQRFHEPAVRDILENLDPIEGTSLIDVHIIATLVHVFASFDWLLIHTRDNRLSNAAIRGLLVQSLFRDTVSFTDIRRAARLIAHGLLFRHHMDAGCRDLLLLLAEVVKNALRQLSPNDCATLKEDIFRRSIVHTFCVEPSPPSVVQEGLAELVNVSLDPTNPIDTEIVEQLCHVWMSRLVTMLETDDLRTPDLSSLACISLWLPYMQPEDLFRLLEMLAHTVSFIQTESAVHLVELVLGALERTDLHASIWRKHSKHLARLHTFVPHLPIVEATVLKALQADLPAALDGTSLAGTIATASLAHLCGSSRNGYSCHEERHDDYDISSFIKKQVWSGSTTRVIAGLLYTKAASRVAFIEWLESPDRFPHSSFHMAVVLHALLDSSRSLGQDIWIEAFCGCFSRFLSEIVWDQNGQQFLAVYTSTVVLMILVVSANRKVLLGLLRKHIEELRPTQITSHLLLLCIRIYGVVPQATQEIVNLLVEKGMHRVVLLFGSEDCREDAAQVIENLSTLAKSALFLQAHLVDTVLTLVVQSRLADQASLTLATVLVQTASLKPSVVNRHLQGVLQHPQFYKVCKSDHPSRDALIEFLFTLFNLHPENTCQPTHINFLTRIYGGTTSSSDQRILAVFKLFEARRKLSMAPLLTRWSPSTDTASSSALEVIQSLDANQVLRTCLSFPQHIRLQNTGTWRTSECDGQLYDPVFLILLFACMLSESTLHSAFDWVQLFRTNVVCLLIRSLSTADADIRELALCQIAGLWTLLEADMQENDHVIYILTLLKNALPPPTTEPARLPCYTTLVLLHALRSVFYPSNFIFPHVSRFLLQRPELDTKDVPMLYSMLYSGADDWKKQRGWILRFLSDGMTSTDDWRVFKRRHTWELLASLFSGSEKNASLRAGILEVLANLTCNSQATTSLILRSGLLTWIEMQLLEPRQSEGHAWAKVLENVILTANHPKLESSTGGEWRAVIARCLASVLRDSTLPVYFLLMRGLLRLSLLPGQTIRTLPQLIAQASMHLINLEHTIDFSNFQMLSSPTLPRPPFQPPHRSRRLHTPLPKSNDQDTLWLWGWSVEYLWRASMTGGHRAPEGWGALTRRLLVWRAMVGKEGSEVGEWARREVVGCVTD